MRTLALGLVVFLSLPATVQADEYEEHEKVIKGLVEGLRDLNDALATVKDRDSAKLAAPKIEKVCDKFEDLAKKVGKLPKLSVEENRKLQEKYTPEIHKRSLSLRDVAAKAGKQSQGEESFVRSAKRLVKVGQDLQKVGALLGGQK